MADDGFASFYRRLLGQLFALTRFRHLYRDRPGMLQDTDPAALPESFRVRLDSPEHFRRLRLALCPERCIDGVQHVIEERALLKPVVAGEPWLARSDVTILLPEGTSAARRDAVRARLEAIDGVKEVAYESPAEAFRRLPERLRRPSRAAPTIGPGSMLASFHVTLAEPGRVGQFHQAFCGSRRTGDCSHGIVVEHPRGQG
ncbi:MAG TPA: permease-like cell division protein FtsX [Actinomycetota bacterium]|nr:permease-like cell division protein FtsX [Actinomycetota bacterium]